jgi:phage tail-like protein
MDADRLWQWEQEMLQGSIRRTNVSIILLDSAGKDKWRWDFKEACPVKWSGPDLKAGTAEVAVETLELTHRGFMSSSGRK